MESAHILVVDDEEEIRDLLKWHLSRNGYYVTTADNGKHALELFQPGLVDVVVTDLKMPRMDGLDLLRELRERDPKVKVIILTGHGSVEAAVTALTDLGAFYFLRKPLHDLQDLDLIIRRAIEQRQQDLENLRLQAEVEEVWDLLHRQAVTDELTDLYNRRHLFRCLEGMRPDVQPITMAVLDIDYFKRINDAHGHATGDRLLVRVAEEIRRHIRSGDIAARYGGDEFVIVLRSASAKEAQRVLQRIQEGIRYLTVEGGKAAIPVSLSAGIASWPEHAASLEDLFHQADQALYCAKLSRNSTCVLGEQPRQNPGEPPARAHFSWSSRYNILASLGDLVAAKEHYTRGHSEEVAMHAVRLGELAGLGPEDTETLYVASLVHDLGKLAIPDLVLNKPGSLTAAERHVMEQHVTHGCRILHQIPQLDGVLQAVLHHHERYDGQGYPHGLQGDEIPLLARILAIADAYVAMTSHRPYRERLPTALAVQELRRHSGTQFDPRLVELFTNWLEQHAEEAADAPSASPVAADAVASGETAARV